MSDLASNTYTGDGTTTLYAFTFPYIDEEDVKVSLDDIDLATDAYTFASSTQLDLDTAPGVGVVIKIYRDTATTTIPNTFYPGGAIRARELNDNFTQALYVIQEANITATEANSSAAQAAADAAQAKADAAAAQTAATTAQTAASTAQTAATSAQTSASSAQTSATAAAADAAEAKTDAAEAKTDAASALTTANAVDGKADQAISTANSANTKSDQAVTTANEAKSAVENGPVQSVNGLTGVVTIDLIPSGSWSGITEAT